MWQIRSEHNDESVIKIIVCFHDNNIESMLLNAADVTYDDCEKNFKSKR